MSLELMSSSSHRQKVCKQLRQEQVKTYNDWMAEVPSKPSKDKPAKVKKKKRKGKKVRFKNKHVIYDAVTRFDDREVVTLLKTGESPDTATETGCTLLHKCCADDNLSIAELLLANKASINKQDDDLWTPLHIAAALDHPELVQLLLQKGADPSLLNYDGHFPLDLAPECSESHVLIREELSERGLSNHKLCEKWLEGANRMMSDVEKHVSSGGDVNAANEEGVTLLHIAIANGYGKVVSHLLDHLADVEATDDVGWTPLHVAAKFGQEKYAKILLKYGANPLAEDCLERKPSEIAVTAELRRSLVAAERAVEEARKKAYGKKKMSVVLNKGLLDKSSLRISTKIVRPPHISLSKRDELFEQEKMHEDLSESDTEEQVMNNEIDQKRISWLSPGTEEVQVNKESLPDPVKNDDLVSLAEITDDIILTELEMRYGEDRIYTYVGDILLALNPFKFLPYYTKQVSDMYMENTSNDSLTPHIFSTAQRAYSNMVKDGRSQVCVISGESGAGKTESCKYFIQHLLTLSRSEECNLNGKIQQVSPLLEAFGNAETVMNNNSSRFGKFVEIIFSQEGLVLGAKITEYLLEKSRIVHHSPGERNYHIYYLMFSGLSPYEKTSFGLQEPNSHRYLRSSDPNEDISQHFNNSEMAEKYLELKDVLQFVGFTQQNIHNMTSILSASLLLGDVNFKPTGSNDAAHVLNRDKLQKIASLLGVPADDLGNALVSDVSITRGEAIKKERTLTQAGDCRDALAKALYGRLFSWIVNGVNHFIRPPEDSEPGVEIGILDIFGFENFVQNNFEQLCINLANEQLQHYFNEHIFQHELEDYKKERVVLQETIKFTNNQPTINLFLEKHTGILAILDEESRFPKATDKTLATKLHKGLGGSYHAYTAPKDGGTSFTITHYAGKINYDVKGMLEKNRDLLPNSVMFTMKTSTSLLVRELFQSKMTRTGTLAPSKRQQKSRVVRLTKQKSKEVTVKSAFDFFRRKKGVDEKKKQCPVSVIPMERKGPTSAAFHFRNSLNDLMTKISSSTPHFVRCIKPNVHKHPDTFTKEYVSQQLKYTGVGETVKIRRLGFQFRPSFEEFFERFPVIKTCCVPLVSTKTEDYLCKQTLLKLKLTGYRVGKTKLFFQQQHVDQLEEASKHLEQKVITAQKVTRGHIARKKFEELLTVKRQQDRLIESFLSDVTTYLIGWLETVTSQRDHDHLRYDDMIRRVKEEEEIHLRAMEDSKRNEEINKSIDELDKLISEAETLLENYTSGRVSLSSTSSEGDLVDNGNEDLRRSLEQLDEVLDAYDSGSPLDEDPFALDTELALNGDVINSRHSCSSDVKSDSAQSDSDVQFVTGATVQDSVIDGAAVGASDIQIGASNFQPSTCDSGKSRDLGEGEDAFLHGYTTPKEGSLRTKVPPPSPAQAADVVANIFPAERHSVTQCLKGQEEMLPPPPPMEDFPPPPPELDDNLPPPPPIQNDWEMGPENGFPRRRSQPQTLTIQGGKRPPAPPKRSPSTRLSSASLSDVPSSPSSQQNSRPSSRQLDKSATPSPDSTIDSRSHSRSSSGSYDRQSVGSAGERHSITTLYDMPNSGFRNATALQRSMSQNSHDRTQPVHYGHPNYTDSMDLIEKRRGSYPKTGVPPPPRFTNGSNNTYEEINDLNSYQRHLLEKNESSPRSLSQTDPELLAMRNKSRPPPLQTQDFGRPPQAPNGRSPNVVQKWAHNEPNMSPPPSFTPPPPPSKKSPKTPQSPILSYRSPQSPRMTRVNEQQERFSPTFGRRNSSPATPRSRSCSSPVVIMPESPPPPVPDQAMRSYTPPGEGPVVQHNIKPSMLKSPAHQQFVQNAARRMSPPSLQNNHQRTPPAPAVKPESPPVTTEVITIQHNMKPSMMKAPMADMTPLVKPSMFKMNSHAQSPPPPVPEPTYRSPRPMVPEPTFRSAHPMVAEPTFRSPHPPVPEPTYRSPHPQQVQQYTAQPPAPPQPNKITHEHLIRPSALKSGPPQVQAVHQVHRPVETLPPPPPPPPTNVPLPPVPPPAVQHKHKVAKMVQPPIAPKKVLPPGTSGSDLLAEIAHVHLKKREKAETEEKEKVPKTPEDQHNAMLAQIRGGHKLKRRIGGFIPEIHGDDPPHPPPQQIYQHQTAEASPPPPSITQPPTSHHMNNTSAVIDDDPLPPPPIDLAFEEESRQYQEFLRLEERRASVRGGSNNMPSSQKGGAPEHSSNDIDVTKLAGYQSVPDNCPVWKRPLIEKKNKEIIEKYLEDKVKQDQEAAKWKDIPDWKKDLMKKKELQKRAELAPAEEERKKQEVEMAKVLAMPEWKQQIYWKRKQEMEGN